MGSTSLRQFLQSLCCNSPWDYAVFWKFQEHQNEMLLVWDDGLFDFSRPIDPMEGMMGSFFFSSHERLSSACASSSQSGNLNHFPIEVAMAEMSSSYYVVGKGLLGEVACTECPIWIFIDNFITGGFNSNAVSECLDELLHQFVAGVKTILLVPLIPHGVLQLGSLDVVQEDAGLVVSVKNKFYAHLEFAACFLTFWSNRNSPVQPTELSAYMENSGESCTSIFKTDEYLKVLDAVDIEGQQMTAASQIMSMIQNSHYAFRKDMTKTTAKGSEDKVNMDSVSLIDVAEPFNPEIRENCESEMIKNLFRSSSLDEELECLSNVTGYGPWNPDKPVYKMMQSYSNHGTVEPSFEVKDCQHAAYGSGDYTLKFPSDSELHKALGHILPNHADLNLSDESAAGNSICKEGTINVDELSAGNYGSHYPNKNKTEHLVQAFVANTSSISNDNSSNRESHCATLFKSSSVNLGSCQLEQGSLTEESQVPWSCVTSAFSGDRNSALNISPSASSFGGMTNTLLEDQPQIKGNSSMRSMKGSKSTGANKQRAQFGENQKSRPRDRQLIQERIKELRELVPNGEKCSIDGLLDRTIKHMQFLASVTDQADKIGKHVVKKASGEKVKSNTKNGTSWAMELENEQQTCPIMVKDLEYPGHMLIQMLCNDHGRFLEIADVIHRLQLTILKGTMETRPDESAWAHFIVEASESFHRLDIFWPLMQLLQQNGTQIPSKV